MQFHHYLIPAADLLHVWDVLLQFGFANEVIENIHNAYRIIYQSGLNTTEALKKIEDEFEKSPEIDYIINFIRNSERGIIK